MTAGEALKRVLHAAGVHRIRTRPSARRVQVRAGGRLLADSTRAIELRETGLPTRFYLPREDVRLELLAPSPTTTHCPFKGDAAYFSTPGAPDAFWSYEQPTEADAAPVAGLLAPRPGPVELWVDGRPRGLRACMNRCRSRWRGRVREPASEGASHVGQRP